MAEIGECNCLDIEHKENILTSLHSDVNRYSTEIRNASNAAKRLRQKGDTKSADMAEHSVDAFKYSQDKLNETLQAVLATKECIRR